MMVCGSDFRELVGIMFWGYWLLGRIWVCALGLRFSRYLLDLELRYVSGFCLDYVALIENRI